jgi:cell wall-associated NlpC family hydrolase
MLTTLGMMAATRPGGPYEHLVVANGYDPSVLQPGDVLVWTQSATVGGHTGIYLGDGQVIHASVSRGVTIDPVDGQFSRSTQRILRPSILATQGAAT